MTPEQASAVSAGMLNEHIGQMKSLADAQLEKTKEWTALTSKLVDKFASGEVTLTGMIERERQELAEKLKSEAAEKTV